MKFQHYNLGHLTTGQAVEVTLQGNAANILLLDSANFSKYQRGQAYEYFGGHATTSITKLPVPKSGHWHVAVDLGGYAGNVRSSVRVLG
ncbi:hypothetical protein CGI33_20745 [Vibrio parahaemolyticus]|uniref:DUF1883 domain-containing protein n=1 Tax=Vibrio parahaemolyticus TaxID=670 RepID=UPI00111EF059|nr:DUF1883 domain-containing protein [Vibrio parahaemolyticus]TOJ74303.1 hypothetical protein CGI33_20745 [Vibrio parahaemolyticus]